MTTFTPSTFWQQDTDYVDFLESHYIPAGEDRRAVSYRVRLAYDEGDYDGPDYDMAAPVINLDDDALVFGKDSERHDGLLNESARSIILGRGLEFFERYLRIFHGGSVYQFHDYDGRRTYVTYDTATMRENYWGCDEGSTSTPENLAGSDFESWVNGETYSITVDHTFAYDEDGEPDWDLAIEDECVHGFYGRDYALMEAEAMLNNYDESSAAVEALAAHRRAISLTAVTIEGDGGYPVSKVEHALGTVVVYEHQGCDDAEPYLVVEIDGKANEIRDRIRIYIDDAPVFGQKEK